MVCGCDGIISGTCKCCESQRRAYFCCTLRCHFIWWMIFVFMTAFLQLAIGSTMLHYKYIVDDILEMVKSGDYGDDMNSAIEVLDQNLGKFWNSVFGITTGRGVFDMLQFLFGIVGVYRPLFLLIHFWFVVVDFIVDAVLYFTLTGLLKAWFIGHFFPASYGIIFVLYGWQMLLGPYILMLLKSYHGVKREGGDGTEFKNADDLRGETKGDEAADANEGAPTEAVEIEEMEPEKEIVVESYDAETSEVLQDAK